jgi:hypothetical protein
MSSYALAQFKIEPRQSHVSQSDIFICDMEFRHFGSISADLTLFSGCRPGPLRSSGGQGEH